MAEMQGGHEYWMENQDQQTSYSVRSSVEGDVNLLEIYTEMISRLETAAHIHSQPTIFQLWPKLHVFHLNGDIQYCNLKIFFTI